MRNYTIPEGVDEDDHLEEQKFAMSDWKDSPGVVLDKLDEILKPFGLEVVLADRDSDSYDWKVDWIVADAA